MSKTETGAKDKEKAMRGPVTARLSLLSFKDWYTSRLSWRSLLYNALGEHPEALRYIEDEIGLVEGELRHPQLSYWFYSLRKRR